MSRITIAELFPKYITAVKWYSFEEKENVRLQKEYGIFLSKGELVVLTTGEYSDRYNVGIYDNFFSLRRKILSRHEKIIKFKLYIPSNNCICCSYFPIEELARHIYIRWISLSVVWDAGNIYLDNQVYNFEIKTVNK